MGSSLTTKIGPFIVITGPKKMIEKKSIKRYCSEHPKDKQDFSNFCSKCGSKILEKEVFNRERLFPSDVIDYIKDGLMVPPFEENIIIPDDEIENVENTLEGGGFLDMSDKQEIMEKETETFKKFYSNGIKKLQESFGEDNVVIGWGVVQYWS